MMENSNRFTKKVRLARHDDKFGLIQAGKSRGVWVYMTRVNKTYLLRRLLLALA